MKIKTKFDIGETVFVVEKKTDTRTRIFSGEIKGIRLTIDSGNNCMTEIKLNNYHNYPEYIVVETYKDYLNVFKTEEEAKKRQTVEDKRLYEEHKEELKRNQEKIKKQKLEMQNIKKVKEFAKSLGLQVSI